MNRKDKPLIKRVFSAISSFALIGAGGYVFFVDVSMIIAAIFAAALLGICTPVILGGGSIIEVITGIVEAFIEGVMAVFDAIGSVFNF